MNELFNIGLQFFAEQQGAKVQEAAAPAADDISSTDADYDNENTDTDGEEYDDGEEFDTDDDSGDTDGDIISEKGQRQGSDKDAAFAEVRRKAEADARIKATQEAERMAAVEVDKIFADMKFTDPYTNKPITSKKEYDAYKARHQTEVISKELSKAGVSREAIDAMIDNHPAVIKAKEAAEGFESAKRHEQETAAKVHIDSQVKEISSLDPDINGIEDIMKLPNYETLKGYVRKGLSLVEAYKLTNMEKLTSKTAKAAAQSAYNKSASKDHLTSSTSRGKGDVSVPKEVLKKYHQLNPKMTDKEIQASYQKHDMKYNKKK